MRVFLKKIINGIDGMIKSSMNMTLNDLFIKIKEFFISLINTPIQEIILFIVVIFGGLFLLVYFFDRFDRYFSGPEGSRRFLKFGKWFLIVLISFTVLIWISVGIKKLFL